MDHPVVDFCTSDVLDDNEEDISDVDPLDVRSSLVELDGFRTGGPYLLANLSLNILMLNAPIFYVSLMSLNSKFSVELLKSIFTS